MRCSSAGGSARGWRSCRQFGDRRTRVAEALGHSPRREERLPRGHDRQSCLREHSSVVVQVVALHLWGDPQVAVTFDETATKVDHVDLRGSIEFGLLVEQRVDCCQQQRQRGHPLLPVNQFQDVAADRVNGPVQGDDRAQEVRALSLLPGILALIRRHPILEVPTRSATVQERRGSSSATSQTAERSLSTAGARRPRRAGDEPRRSVSGQW